jgi:acetyl esterase/lipase
MESAEVCNLPKGIPLWPEGKIPQPSEHDGDLPRLTVYLPSEEYRTGQSVLVLPGGGYSFLSSAKEGHRPAQLLAAKGIAAAVLEYRHAPQRHPVPLMDAQRGLRCLRAVAEGNGLNPRQVGVMGFSAGGHLAGCLATQPPVPEGEVGDALDAVSCRPDFAALIYPVVSFTAGVMHSGSRTNLLGPDVNAEDAARLSIEQAVNADTPPMFLFHTQEDAVVPVENTLLLAQALAKHQVPLDLHVTADGEHGIGLAANHVWGDQLLHWLEGLASPP